MIDDDLTPDEIGQLRQLIAGGDSRAHYHSSDRNPSHDTVTMLETQKNSRIVIASGNINYTDDYLFVDTTGGAVILTLPLAKGGNKFTVVRIAGANNVTISRTAPDTVNGAASITISASYSPVSLKSVKGTGYLQT